MIRAALVAYALIACKSKSEPAPTPAKPVERKPVVTIEPAAAKLPGELWFIDETDGHRVLRVVKGEAREIGKGTEKVFGALYPTSQRVADGRILAIASFGDGRPEGERLVLIGERGSIATLGAAALAVRDPAVSPDGTWIAAAVMNDDGITNLTVFTAASGAARPLTTNPEGNFAPVAISTEAIAFASSRDGDSEIYRMNIDGSKVQRLTAFHRDDWAPTIDVSGEQLAFTSDREQKRARLFVVKPDGTGLRRVTKLADDAAEESALVWSPISAKAYAYSVARDKHVQVVSVLGEAEKVITPAGADDSDVAFSPDGAWLALVRHRAGQPTELVAVPLPAGSGEQVVVARGAIRTPRWF